MAAVNGQTLAGRGDGGSGEDNLVGEGYGEASGMMFTFAGCGLESCHLSRLGDSTGWLMGQDLDVVRENEDVVTLRLPPVTLTMDTMRQTTELLIERHALDAAMANIGTIAAVLAGATWRR